MASVATARIDASEEDASPVRSSVPSLCLTASLKHNKRDALNHKIGGEWINIPAEAFVAPAASCRSRNCNRAISTQRPMPSS